MKYLYCLILSLYGNAMIAGDFVVAPIVNVPHYKTDSVRIKYNERHRVYYTSPVFDIEKKTKKFTLYNLYGIYLDSDSIYKPKRVQIKIPKGFQMPYCSIDSNEQEYHFLAKDRKIIVSVPSIAKDTLQALAYSKMFTYDLEDQKLNKLTNQIHRERSIVKDKYIGIIQDKSYTLSYYNLSRKQKEFLESINKK